MTPRVSQEVLSSREEHVPKVRPVQSNEMGKSHLSYGFDTTMCVTELYCVVNGHPLIFQARRSQQGLFVIRSESR